MDLVEKYKKLVAESKQIDDDALVEKKRLYKIRNEKMDVLVEASVQAELAMKNYDKKSMKEIDDVSFKFSKMKNAKKDEIEKYENLVKFIIGKGKREVLRVKKEELKFNSSAEITMFDEMYDSDALSLRAVIVSNEGKYHDGLKHVLYVFGYGENSGWLPENKVDDVGIRSINGKEFRPNVSRVVMKADDFDVVLNYYNNNIMGFVVNNGVTEFLRKTMIDEEMSHALREKLFAEYTLDDVLEMIAYRCPDCGKDAVLKSDADSMMREHYCYLCKAEFVKVE